MTAAILEPAKPAHFPVEDSKTTPHGLRLDIQALRGWAIILVVLQHARFPYLPGGFLGVDIFFVISGYLMTGIISRGLDEGRFSFASFYARRIRRLLPAAYATLVVTALIAPWLLESYEYRDFLAQLGGSFTFVVNFVLWRQAGYFNTGAALKPLLHMWSLAVEEQYYIILPLLLFLCPARLRLAFSVALTLASGALCIWLLQKNPTLAFYMLPTRAWELGIGSVTALLVRKALLQPRPMPVLRILCGALLLIAPIVFDERGHPGLPAAIVCLATAILMIPGADLPASRPLAPLVAIGDRSYSLYLVHWPVFAFANNVFLNPPPGVAAALLLIPCVLWMEAQYRLFEQPFRAMRVSWRTVGVLALVPVIILGASFAWARVFVPPTPESRVENFGLSQKCDAKAGFIPRSECRSAPDPQTMVWGDSFGMHLVPGLVVSTPGGIIQATTHGCGPFLGLAPTNAAQPAPWAKNCLRFNDSVLEYLARSPQIHTVIISSSLVQYLPGSEDELHWKNMVRDGGALTIRPQSPQALVDSLARSAAAVHALGKRVVLVAPPPSAPFDIARCSSRLQEGKPTVSAYAGCDFTRETYQAYRRPTLDFLAEVKRRNLVPVLSFDDDLCATGRCLTTIGGTVLYRDGGHLSVPGSRLLGRSLNLGVRATALAR